MTAEGVYSTVLIACVTAGLTIWIGIWRTRDNNLSSSTITQQWRRSLYHAVWLALYLSPAAIYFYFDRFEQDGTWHQTIVRDEPVVEVKIILVIVIGALFLFSGIASYLYAITRLMYFSTTTKIPYLLMALTPYLLVAMYCMASINGLMTIDNFDLISNFDLLIVMTWFFSLVLVLLQVFANIKGLYRDNLRLI